MLGVHLGYEPVAVRDGGIDGCLRLGRRLEAAA
jgi:hypothetical protein